MAELAKLLKGQGIFDSSKKPGTGTEVDLPTFQDVVMHPVKEICSRPMNKMVAVHGTEPNQKGEKVLNNLTEKMSIIVGTAHAHAISASPDESLEVAEEEIHSPTARASF